MAASHNTALAVVSQTQQVEAYAPVDYTREQVQLIKDTYAKGATDAELALFVEIAKRKGLDIFSKQICLIGRWDNRLGKEVRDPQTTIDGYRLIAERTGRYVPGRDTTYQYDGQRLMSATAYVKKLVAGEWHEIAATAFFDEYKQTKKDGGLNATWNKMPHVMIAKCAESLALRKAFPSELSGIYTQEEMSQAVDATFSTEPTPHLTVTNLALPALERPVEQLASELVAHVTRENGEYEVADGAEIFTISKGAQGVECSCGSQGLPPCAHRLAVAMWAKAQKEAPAPEPPPQNEPDAIDAEPIDAPQFDDEKHQQAFDAQMPSTNVESDPALINKSQLIVLCGLTKQLEGAGIEELAWRDQLEKITGSRSRKGVMQDELAKVIFAFNKALEAAQRKQSGKAKAK